jgi:hypothetical protein
LDCTNATAVPSQLWPPNHELIPVSIAGVTDPDGDPVTITITGVTQDEPVGDGDTGNPCPDASGTGGSVVELRAERQGDGDGRVYHIAFTADDGHGSECTGVVSVCVPKHFGPNRTCVDEGSLFDSTADTCATECSEACGLEIATSSVCGGEKLPRLVNQQFVRARQLLIRAAKQHDQRKVGRLLFAAMARLHKAERVAAHAAQAGQISADCAHSTAATLTDARLRVQQWLGNP